MSGKVYLLKLAIARGLGGKKRPEVKIGFLRADMFDAEVKDGGELFPSFLTEADDPDCPALAAEKRESMLLLGEDMVGDVDDAGWEIVSYHVVEARDTGDGQAEVTE